MRPINKLFIPFIIILSSVSVSVFLYIQLRDSLFQVSSSLGNISAISVFLILGFSYLIVYLFLFINRLLGREEISFLIKSSEHNKSLPFSPSLLIIGIVLLSVISASVAYYIITSNGTPTGLTLHEKTIIEYDNSRYVRVDDDVYFLKAGYGYYKLKDAHADSFTPFSFDHEYSGSTFMGKDKNHVFAKQFIIPNLNKDNAVYLGKNYIRDKESVFYENTQIMGAEVESFQQLTFGTNIFSRYSNDNTQVYYKNLSLPNADIHSISYAGIAQSKNSAYVNNYIKDKQHAYYENRQLVGVDTHNFKAERLNQTLSYASDGKKHFINGISFPKIVKNKFYGTVKPNLDEMMLLQKKGASHFHMIFSDGTAIYYFDEQKQMFIHAKSLEQLSSFQYIDNGIFSDGEFIYFTVYKKIGAFRSGRGTSGHMSYIYKSQLKSKGFLKFKEINRATIYQHNKDFYVALHEHPSLPVNASLVKLINPNITNGVIKRKNLEKVSDVSVVLKIKTRF